MATAIGVSAGTSAAIVAAAWPNARFTGECGMRSVPGAAMAPAAVPYSWKSSGSGLHGFHGSAVHSGTRSRKAWGSARR
ncbi:hypothetical protein OHB41_18405 [Streptomyces sp. NBC_01571]|uniref:hypothetical protein n=1 Tax=Streptomyces sp. NBC_01571 TaxID=2975883 RepID=UPI00224ECCC5|nr:hypothetical protein [Streptomyces sp. NBC_01571]MCX4575123.1 hypothetical protein [Streptomyces sp. NBC_01571]